MNEDEIEHVILYPVPRGAKIPRGTRYYKKLDKGFSSFLATRTRSGLMDVYTIEPLEAEELPPTNPGAVILNAQTSDDNHHPTMILINGQNKWWSPARDYFYHTSAIVNFTPAVVLEEKEYERLKGIASDYILESGV